MTSIEIRPASRHDVESIVKVHQRAFPTEFLTSLGPSFLTWYYNRAIRSSDGICLVAVEIGEVLGFVCGSHEKEVSVTSVTDRNSDAVRAALSIIASRPQKLLPLSKRFLWLYSERGKLAKSDVELASLATDPTQQGRGIGRQLVQAFSHLAEELGCETISLTTNEHENDGVRRFYENLGFELTTQFERDRPMVQFIAPPSLLT